MAPRAKPTPRIVSEVCSLCGLDWQLHGDEPTTETCIRLLAAEVRRLESAVAARPFGYPISYPVPYPVPYQPYPRFPWQRQYPYTVWNQASGAHSHAPTLSAVTPLAISSSSSC